MKALELLMIRHGEVEAAQKSICYGEMNVLLSEQGRTDSQALAERMARRVPPLAIYHSDLSRTRTLAQMIADCYPSFIEVIPDWRLRERDYGDWQGMTWDDIYHSDPDHFHDLIQRPDTYRPPGGETTSEMQTRVVRWYESIQRDFVSNQGEATERKSSPTVIAISHSGPIAALAGKLSGLHARDWAPWMLRTLGAIRITWLPDQEIEIRQSEL